MGKRAKEPRVVIEDGEPTAVILDIQEYRELLEKVQDLEDLKRLDQIRKKGPKYRRLSEFLAEH